LPAFSASVNLSLLDLNPTPLGGMGKVISADSQSVIGFGFGCIVKSTVLRKGV